MAELANTKAIWPKDQDNPETKQATLTVQLLTAQVPRANLDELLTRYSTFARLQSCCFYKVFYFELEKS